MKKFLAVLAVLTLVSGTVGVTTAANASNTYLFPPNQNEGANN